MAENDKAAVQKKVRWITRTYLTVQSMAVNG